SGKRRWITLPDGTTKKEAKEALAEIEKQVKHGTYMPSRVIPVFSAIADAWLTSKKPSLRKSTHQQYEGHINNHLAPFLGEMKVTQVTFDILEKFKKDALEKGVTPETLKKIFVTLSAILDYAVRVRCIDHNPSFYVERPKGNSVHHVDNSGQMNILKPHQIRELLDATPVEKDRILFMTAVFSGMREGELLGAKWDDFDWANCQIQVRRTYNHGQFYEPKTKTSRRRIDLAPELIHELKKWKLACPKGELNLVFPSSMGTPDSADNMLKRRFFPALVKAGLHRIRFHDLRHTYASLLIDQGENCKYVQVQMGHSSIKITMDTYGHLMSDVNQEAACKLGRCVLGGNFEGFGSKMVAK
ncbi:MAG: site-specific integrase, partial [Syntrophobacteraceae bacterium]